MNNIAKEIEVIQQELDQLHFKQLELAKARQSDLKLHSINDEIVRFRGRLDNVSFLLPNSQIVEFRLSYR